MAPLLHPWVFVFGVLGNVVSFLVYVAPVPTFWRVYKKKSTEKFHSLPYVCAIFSAMLWVYYALLKTNAFLIITINCFGCIVEIIYITIFIIYAHKEARIATFKLLVLLDLVGFSTVILVCSYIARESIRVRLLGWICVIFSVVVFAAPLSVIRLVIRTKSVEFLPFPLSLTLTISAVMWFMYGLLKKDKIIVLPNLLGFIFGVVQMILYVAYRKPKTEPKIDLEKNSRDAPATVNITSIADPQPKTDGVVAGKKDDDFTSRELHVQTP